MNLCNYTSVQFQTWMLAIQLLVSNSSVECHGKLCYNPYIIIVYDYIPSY
jgi:hypothetical protein